MFVNPSCFVLLKGDTDDSAYLLDIFLANSFTILDVAPKDLPHLEDYHFTSILSQPTSSDDVLAQAKQ